MTSKFNRGDNVRILGTGKIGTINEIIDRPDGYAYRVTVDGKTKTYQEKYLERYIDEEQEILKVLELNIFGEIDDFHLFQTWYRLKRPVEGNFYSYLGSRTLFNPFQFKPLAKFISPSSDERLFIADEVGVGKTIETGIIFTELLARGRIDRHSPILIVCPNSLGPKWIKEMKERFNLRFRLQDGKSLRNALVSVISGGYLPEDSIWSIVSIELIRMKNYNELLQEINAHRGSPVWSIVVVDEAHHMRNTATESNNLGYTLSGMTEMMLMLSATPLNLRDSDLFNQMTILNPALFPDQNTFNAMLSPIKSINRCRRLISQNTSTLFGEIIGEIIGLCTGPLGSAISRHPRVRDLLERLKKGGSLASDEVVGFERMLTSLSPLNHSFTRTLKREALGHRVTREVMKVPVSLSRDEMSFYQEVIQAIQDAYLDRGGDAAALGFITNMPRRMLSSCIPAMRLYLDWCLEKDMEMVLSETILSDADDDGSTESTPLTPELRKEFTRLRNHAANLALTDTKYQEFSVVLSQLHSNLENPRIIVFSFFVRTLKYLRQRLQQDGYRVGLICGEVPVEGDGIQAGRFDIMDTFEKGEIDILLSSEVGGEGLDFQYCQAIINYDLPYNPMRVEQRIGRIDRFGQVADKVIVASMYLAGTLDEDIYHALYERIKLVEDSVGELEPIIGSSLLNIQQSIISGQLSAEQLEQRIKELELTVAQAKIEMQQFENSRAELLGEEVFSDYFQNMGQDNQFVQPSDAAKLTAICLSKWRGCSYETISEERGQLLLSKDIKKALIDYTRKPGTEASIDELGHMVKGNYPLQVIFDGSQADSYRDHCFLPPCGYWTRFLLAQVEDEGDLPRVFRLRVTNADGLEYGSYLVPLFESVIHGIRDEIDMNAVPVNLRTGQVVDYDYRLLSRKIFNNTTETNTEHDNTGNYNHFIDLAAEALDHQIEARADKLESENQYRIDTRIESLRKGSEVRIERHRKIMDEHRQRMHEAGQNPNPEFIRLREAQITIEKSRTEEKISSLSQTMHMTPASSLIGIVLLQVERD